MGAEWGGGGGGGVGGEANPRQNQKQQNLFSLLTENKTIDRETPVSRIRGPGSG